MVYVVTKIILLNKSTFGDGFSAGGCISNEYRVTRFLMVSVRGIARIAPIDPRTQLQKSSDRIIVQGGRKTLPHQPARREGWQCRPSVGAKAAGNYLR